MTSPFVIPNDSATGAFVAPQGDIGRALAQLGAGVGGFGEGLGSITNPYGDFHEKIREMLASNPEALGNLADFAHENPTAFGTLSKMFPRDVLGAITQVKPSDAARRRARVNPEIERLRGMTPEQVNAMHPTTAQLEAYREMTGTAPGQSVATETAGAEAAGERVSYESLSPAEKAQADRYSIPFFKHQQDVADQERLRREFQHASTAATAKDRLDRMHDLTVEMALRRYGVGTVESWNSYYDDPKVQRRAHDLASGVIHPVSEQDQQLLQMGMAIGQAPSGQRAREQANHIRTMTAIRDRITNGYHVSGEPSGTLHHDTPEDIKAVYLPALQRELDILASPQFGGPKLKAAYVPPPPRDIHHPGTFFHRSDRLQITDETGASVDPGIISNITTNPEAADPNAVSVLLASNPAAAEAWNRIVQSGDIRGGLAALHAADLKNGRTLTGGMWKQIMDVLSRVSPALMDNTQ